MKIKGLWLLSVLVLSWGCAQAAAPIFLSSVPSISSSVLAGDTPTAYTYTISNVTGVPINVAESIQGNTSSVVVSQACATVPAKGSCNFVVNVSPSFDDISTGISSTVVISYNGRLPAQITSPITLTVGTPSLVSVQVTPASSTVLANSVIPFTATATYSNGATNDVSTLATWSSSSPTVVEFPVGYYLRNIALTLAPSSSPTATVTATYQTLTATASITVNSYSFAGGNNLYVCEGPNMSVDTFTASSCIETTAAFTSPLSVYALPNSRYAYVSGNGDTLQVCTVNAAASATADVLGSSCTDAQIGGGSASNVSISGIQFVQIAGDINSSYLYLARNDSLNVYACRISQANGLLYDCVLNDLTTVFGSGYLLNGISVNPIQNVVYLNARYETSSTEEIVSCSTASGNVLTDCNVQQTLSSGYANKSVVNYSGTQLYLAGPDIPGVYQCPINGLTVSSCVQTSIAGAGNMTGIGYQYTSSGEILYVADSQGTYLGVNIYGICTLTSGAVTSCALYSTGFETISTPNLFSLAIR